MCIRFFLRHCGCENGYGGQWQFGFIAMVREKVFETLTISSIFGVADHLAQRNLLWCWHSALLHRSPNWFLTKNKWDLPFSKTAFSQCELLLEKQDGCYKHSPVVDECTRSFAGNRSFNFGANYDRILHDCVLRFYISTKTTDFIEPVRNENVIGDRRSTQPFLLYVESATLLLAWTHPVEFESESRNECKDATPCKGEISWVHERTLLLSG